MTEGMSNRLSMGTIASDTVYGVFREEIKNRFLCTVNIDGSDTVCYIPSSCRLSNFINLTNRTVMLRPVKTKGARARYSVFAVKYRRGYVPLNLSGSNMVIKESLGRRLFSFLGARDEVFRERMIDDYKSDLYIADTDTVIEIKSILSFSKEAIFPTVYSERADGQLRDIAKLLADGHRVWYLLVSMYSGVDRISINSEQTTYYSLFRDCLNHGMKAAAFSLGMKKTEVYVKSRVALEI